MKKQLHLLLFATLLVFSAPACAKDVAGAALSMATANESTAAAQVHEAFVHWLDAIATGSSSAVSQLYVRDAVLLPTLSPVLRDTPAARKEYFDEFTAKPGLKGAINEEHIRIFGDVAVNSGLYTFTYTKDGKTVTLPARFSFVYHKNPQGWLIVDHHSSQLPKQ